MQLSIIVVYVLFTFIQSAFDVSAIVLGYDCDNTFIPSERLQDAVDKAYAANKKFKYSRKRLSSWYDGPPFMEPYFLWPVSPTTKHYGKAEKTPYRIVLDENSRFFSVIMKEKDGPRVKECKMRDEMTSNHISFDYDCSGSPVRNNELRRAAEAACPNIGVYATQIFPARLRIDRMKTLGTTTLVYYSGRHLYISPVQFNQDYLSRSNPGTKFVVMDSACTVVSVIEEMENFEQRECRTVLSTFSGRNRYLEP